MNKVLRLSLAVSCTALALASWTTVPARAVDQPGAAKPVVTGVSYEAEAGKLDGGATIQGDSAASGGKVVGSFHVRGANVTLANVDGGKGGASVLLVTYATPTNTKNTLYVNDVKVASIEYPSTGGWFGAGMYKDKSIPITLKAGTANTLKFVSEDGDNAVNLDKVTVAPAPPPAPK